MVSYGGQRYSIAIAADSEMWVEMLKAGQVKFRTQQASKVGEGIERKYWHAPISKQTSIPQLGVERWLVEGWGGLQ